MKHIPAASTGFPSELSSALLAGHWGLRWGVSGALWTCQNVLVDGLPGTGAGQGRSKNSQETAPGLAGGEGTSVHAFTVSILCCCLFSSCWTSSPELGLCQRGGTHKYLLWSKNKVSLWPSSDISQGSSPKLLCSLPRGERFTLWPWACKGLRPEPLGTGWFSAHRTRGTLCPDASVAPTAAGRRCCAWPSSYAFSF